jgi:cytochrome b involved in lipid metabolism
MGSMTEWLDDHPGGSEIIMSNRSRDVTPIFNPRHPSDQLDKENLPPTVHHLGKKRKRRKSESRGRGKRWKREG